jgi:SSS family solute:Na+ symporter
MISDEIRPFYSHIRAHHAIPVIALILILYGVLGGLFAAAWTDTLQGILILILSVILLPVGLQNIGWFSGLHGQLPDQMFQIVGSSEHSDYTWYYILALIIMNLVGVVAQPHIFATGGGGAKNEMSARIGLVFGNFLKRFSTIMWGFTGVVAFALFGKALSDPDMVWGYATSQLLGPGLVGLMIACLLAAAMSSADAFMICGSALFTRNLYTPVFPNRSETHYVRVGRIVSVAMVIGAIALSLYFQNVLSLIKYIWQLPVIFGAVFWISVLWRKVTKIAALSASTYSFIMIVLLPNILPQISKIANNPRSRILSNPNLFMLDMFNIPLDSLSNSWLMTLSFSMDVIMPFIILILVSLFTKPPEKQQLDQFFARFHTPVSEDREEDRLQVDKSIQNPHRFDNRKLFPRSQWELMKPDKVGVIGFVLCFGLTLIVLGFAFFLSNLGSP